MKHCILIAVILSFFTNSFSQELFRVDFEEAKAPEGWTVNDKSEWVHVLGEDNSDYFRFHPFSHIDKIETPLLDLQSGYYVLNFSWNETGSNNPDFVNVRIKKNDEPWLEISDFGGLEGGATNRTWKKDSAVIGNLEEGSYLIQFQYKSIGSYPSQYIGLDNIYFVQSDIITGLQPILEQVIFNLYPNPATTQLKFSIEDNENRIFTAKIVNASGQLVKEIRSINTSGENIIDVSSLSKGNYLLQLISEEGIKTESFVIQ